MGWLCGGDEEQAQERQQEADHPEPGDYLRFLPSFELKVVVDGRHGEDALAVAQLEAAYLEDYGCSFHNEDAADDDEEDFLRGADRRHAEGAPQGQGAGIPHEDLGRVAVVPQEAQAGPHHGHHEDAYFIGSRMEGNVQAVRYRLWRRKYGGISEDSGGGSKKYDG